MKNWKVFLKTLGMAAFGGATSGAIAGIASGSLNPKALGISVATGSLVAIGAYLKQSPLCANEPPPTPRSPPSYTGI